LQETAGYYDAAGRLTAVLQGIGVDNKTFFTQYFYSEDGSVRRVKVTHDQIAPSETSNPGQVTEDYWYDYDAMGRMTLSQGQLINGYVARGATGTSIEYDAAGQRTSVITSRADGNGLIRDHKENYDYYASGYLRSSAAADSAGYVLGTTPPQLNDPDFHRMSVIERDALSRVRTNTEYNASGVNVFQHSYTYTNDGQVLTDTGFTLQSDGARLSSSTSYDYRRGLLYRRPQTARQPPGCRRFPGARSRPPVPGLGHSGRPPRRWPG